MSRALSLAGFQVTLIGRIWVTPEGKSAYLSAVIGSRITVNPKRLYRNVDQVLIRSVADGTFSWLVRLCLKTLAWFVQTESANRFFVIKKHR